MSYINIHEAKTNLSKLVQAIESGVEQEITIARNGRPAARLVPIAARGHHIVMGIAKGKFVVPADIDGDNAAIARDFFGDAD